MSTSIFAPRIDSAFLLTPALERIDLDVEKGGWQLGYGHMNYLFSDAVLNLPGDEDGSFSVNLNRGGMWIIDANLTQEDTNIFFNFRMNTS
jgi:hypothetical protein